MASWCRMQCRAWPLNVRAAKRRARARFAIVATVAAATSLLVAWPSGCQGARQVQAEGRPAFLLAAFWVVGIILAIVVALIIALVFFVCFGGSALGRLVEVAIESLDRDIIGVDVNIDSVLVEGYTGKIVVRNLKIDNPAPYSSPYLLNAGKVKVDINMLQLLMSGFRTVTVQSLILEDVDAIWEKSGLRHSNVKAILEFIEEKRQANDKPGNDSSSAAPAKVPKKEEGPKKAALQRRTFLRHVKVQDVGVKLASHLMGGKGMRLAVADIDYKDFSGEIGKVTFGDIAQELLYSILKSIVQNTAGKTLGDHLF